MTNCSTGLSPGSSSAGRRATASDSVRSLRHRDYRASTTRSVTRPGSTSCPRACPRRPGSRPSARSSAWTGQTLWRWATGTTTWKCWSGPVTAWRWVRRRTTSSRSPTPSRTTSSSTAWRGCSTVTSGDERPADRNRSRRHGPANRRVGLRTDGAGVGGSRGRGRDDHRRHRAAAAVRRAVPGVTFAVETYDRGFAREEDYPVPRGPAVDAEEIRVGPLDELANDDVEALGPPPAAHVLGGHWLRDGQRAPRGARRRGERR